jgi:Rv0078B-related antitoxin
MHDIGLEMLRQRLRREHPSISHDEIEVMVRAWVSDRPYDSPGRPVELSSS